MNDIDALLERLTVERYSASATTLCGEAAAAIRELRAEVEVLKSCHANATDDLEDAQKVSDALRAALRELLADMALEFDGNRGYDVYQVRKGAIDEARAVIDEAKKE